MSSLLIDGCATKPPDEYICVELSLSTGYCIKTISNVEQYVTDDKLIEIDGKKFTWFDLRAKTVQLPIKSWEKMKEFIIKICKNNQQCSQVSDWNRAVNAIDSKLKN